ncbi:MAG TPA: hypothetical protein VEP90_13625 [Methylomirabilota bacterium]|nr:hypothetical protein [Methylomirabilota bacterium]
MDDIIQNTNKNQPTFKKILGHIGAAILVLVAIALCIDLIHRNLLLGGLGLVLIPTLAGTVLTKLGYNLKTSPLFQETGIVTVAKYVLLGLFLVLILIFAIWSYFNLYR